MIDRRSEKNFALGLTSHVGVPRMRSHQKALTTAGQSAEIYKHCAIRRSQRLFKRCDNPSLPHENTLYATAKRLEYDGDIAGALEMLYGAMQSGERVDTCMKDIAGLLNMMGRAKEAIEFLKAHEDKVTNKVGYVNLLTRLESDANRESSLLPRGVRINVYDKTLGTVTLQLCDRLFPNPAKIRRILYSDEFGYIATVHFASHSSARKALQIQKMCPDKLLCEWADETTEVRLREYESLEETHEISARREWVPSHLRSSGSTTIPIYREPLPDAIAAPDVSHVSSGVSPISTMSAPMTDFCKSPPSVLQDIISNHHELFVQSQSYPPFITDLDCEDGRSVSAMVIPFEDEVDQSRVTKIFNYARALGVVASAMTTVASVLETRRRQNGCMDQTQTHVFQTPVRGRVHTQSTSTPSPVIMRNMFT